MSKITPNDTSSGYNLSAVNDNFDLIAEHLNDKVLYRDNPSGEPNTMNNNLDMNNNRILNLPAPNSELEPVRLKDLTSGEVTIVFDAADITFTPTTTLSSTTTQSAIEEVDAKTVTNASAITSLSSTVAGQGSSITSLQSTQATHTSQISAIQAVDTTQNTHLTTIDGQIATLQSQVSAGNGLKYLSPGIALTANTTLTAAQAGGWFVVGVQGITATLPALSAVVAGGTYTFTRSDFYYTIACAGSDVIGNYHSAASYFALKNSTVTFVKNGNAWYITQEGVSPHAPYFYDPGTIWNMNGTATDGASVQIFRSANYSGGTAGYVNTSLTARTDVINASATAFEWAFLGQVNNYANAGENVGGYLQGNKYSTGPTWAGCFEAIDHTATVNPTSGLIGIEVDVRANGTDTNYQRVGVDIVASRPGGTGTGMLCGYGIRLQNGGDTSGGFTIGVAINSVCTIGFDTANATSMAASLRMASGQYIAFEASSTHRLSWQGGTNPGLVYGLGATEKIRLGQDGSVKCIGTNSITYTGNIVGGKIQVIIDGTTYYLAYTT